MKKLYDKFLRISENEKITEQKFIAKIATSVFTIFLSVVMLCGTTFAYFTDVQSASVANIDSAHYQLDVLVDNTLIGTATNGNPYTYTCPVDKDTVFVLKATGNATTGYCIITVDGGETINTEPIPKGTTFTVNCSKGTTVTFAPSWVVASAGSNTSGLTIGTIGASILIEEEISDPQYTLHIVSDGETLQTIAELYGITVEEICEYNDIPSDTVLETGQQIAIPVTKKEAEEPQPTPTVEPSPSIEPTPTPTAESSTTVEPTEEPVEEPTEESIEEPTEEPTEEPIEDSAEESSPTVEPSPSAEVSPSVESTPTLDPDAVSEISDEIKTEESADTISAEPAPSPSASPNVTTDNTNENETDI